MSDDGRAVAAVARILRAAPDGDPDVAAMEIIAALRGHGWRPTAAAPAPRLSPPLDEDRMHAIAAQARQAITRQEDTHD